MFPVSRTETNDRVADAATRAIAHLIKSRARHYDRCPMALEALYPGLASAPVDTLIAVAAHLVEREKRPPHRWFGFGGEVGLVNAEAARLLGRARRRYDVDRPSHD